MYSRSILYIFCIVLMFSRGILYTIYYHIILMYSCSIMCIICLTLTFSHGILYRFCITSKYFCSVLYIFVFKPKPTANFYLIVTLANLLWLFHDWIYTEIILDFPLHMYIHFKTFETCIANHFFQTGCLFETSVDGFCEMEQDQVGLWRVQFCLSGLLI